MTHGGVHYLNDQYYGHEADKKGKTARETAYQEEPLVQVIAVDDWRM